MKSTWENETAATLAQADGSVETLRLTIPQLTITLKAGSYRGELEDVRERITSRTLSGGTVSVRTGVRRILSTWNVSGLSPDDAALLTGFLHEASKGWPFHILYPDGRTLLARIASGSGSVTVMHGGGETRIGFKADHSPADPDLILAANFDDDVPGEDIIPDWAITPVSITHSSGVSRDTACKQFGTASLKIDTAALVYAAHAMDPIRRQSIAFFYLPDYSGSPESDRTFISWCNADGEPLITLTHKTNGSMELAIEDGYGNAHTTTTTGAVSMISGQWIHLRASFDRDANTSALHVDGNIQASVTGGLPTIPFAATRPGVLVIGAEDPIGVSLAGGHIDALRISAAYADTDTIPVPTHADILA